MLIGTVQAELYLPGLGSLKEKRFVLKSLKTRIRNRFNVSVAEVDYQEKWQRSILGIACVSNDRRYLDTTITNVMKVILQETRVEVIDQVVEIL